MVDLPAIEQRANEAHRPLSDGEGGDCGAGGCGGQLERTSYKGDDALVCSECETPAVRTWSA